MESDARIHGTAKHAVVARALLNDISRGKYKIGAMLPSESELTTAFGISRQTVRFALRHLRDLGMIEARHGVGSVLKSRQPTTGYAYSFDSISDLLQYAVNTKVRVLSREEIALDATQAAWLGCREGEVWWKVRTIRRKHAGGAPIASAMIMLPYAYGQVLYNMGKTREPIFALIEKTMGESATEILQDIFVADVPAEHAVDLGLDPGHACALCIERRYFGRTGNLFEVSRSFHPGDTFRYSMRLRLKPALQRA